MTRVLCIACLILIAATAVAEEPQQRFRIESAVWCSGELRGQPRLDLAIGETGKFEIDAVDSRWRLQVEIEPPAATEGAQPDSIWLKVGIEEQVDGEWEFLTDTMIGQPLGQSGRITVSGTDDDQSQPGTAPLYVEMIATRIE
ncbi:MAG: hypothetical protein CVV18_06715 [Gammaproteobacteria bacterium HGW-Gammaproteobacteria-8]|nr:MAG: hypothetical protein CVV18_06715 [Gammaproteobacteria bacterium HGW-Gammaproteobacteria-8]